MELCLPPPGNGLHLRRNIVTTTIEAFRKLALSLPQAEEKAHFDLPSFRVGNKIFATIHAKPGRVMIKLSPVDQSVFCRADTIAIYPVPGYWGKGGAQKAGGRIQ
ncbi:MAG TPA: MmcQ/YjbR family DNA-binding protein [Chitinophagaceae bacterium]|jgi:hypothetical protein|nr:MmcQ/YjbR family DNA-binding protein [Chitinophagaceae bacterium]